MTVYNRLRVSMIRSTEHQGRGARMLMITRGAPRPLILVHNYTTCFLTVIVSDG